MVLVLTEVPEEALQVPELMEVAEHKVDMEIAPIVEVVVIMEVTVIVVIVDVMAIMEVVAIVEVIGKTMTRENHIHILD